MAYNIKEILENATSQGYKTNIIKPLMGVLIILSILSLLFSYFGKQDFAYISLLMVFLTLIVLFIAYGYCVLKNPDLLRSEKYNLEKSAMEKVTIAGDSLSKSKIIPPTMDYVVIESTKSKKLESIKKEIGE